MKKDMCEWQPIETAPKDTLCLVAHHKQNYWRGKVVIAYHHSNYNGHDLFTEDGIAGWPISPTPTHWMPLPIPPQEDVK